MRRSIWFTRVAGAVVSASLLLGVSAVPAEASERHFIHITTHGAPTWWADAQLYAQDGTQVFSWSQGRKIGGSDRWNFTWNGDRGWIDVRVKGVVQVAHPAEAVTRTKLSLDRDYCFQTSADGHAKYTGDSETGGCH